MENENWECDWEIEQENKANEEAESYDAMTEAQNKLHRAAVKRIVQGKGWDDDYKLTGMIRA